MTLYRAHSREQTVTLPIKALPYISYWPMIGPVQQITTVPILTGFTAGAANFFSTTETVAVFVDFDGFLVRSGKVTPSCGQKMLSIEIVHILSLIHI